jgi:hypothetical protein
VFLGVVAVAWASLTLAGFDAFTRGRLIALAAPVAIAGLVWIWLDRVPRQASDACRPAGPWWIVAPAVCLVAAGAWSAHPEEPFVDGGDAAIYANAAAIIQHRGGLTVVDPMVAGLTDRQRAAFFDRDPVWPHVYNRFPAGLQLAGDDVHLAPNFFRLLPASMAGLAALARSMHAGLFVSPLAGILAILALWLLGTRLSSPFAATAAAALLTVSSAHIWFSRVAVPEMLTECLVVSGLYFAVRAAQERSSLSGVLAGAAFGLAAAARLDVIVLVTPIVAIGLALVAIRRRWTRATTWFAIVFVALTAQAGWLAWGVTPVYVRHVLQRIDEAKWWSRPEAWTLPAVFAGAALVVILVSRWKAAVTKWPALRLGLSILLLAAVVRSWPQFWSGPFALLLTPPGLVLMACGAVWLAFDADGIAAPITVTLFVASAVVYSAAGLDVGAMPMAWRRLVPVVLPLGVLFAGHALDVVGRLAWQWRSIAAAGLVALLLVTAGRSRPLAAASFRTGVAARVADLDAKLPAQAVVLADPSTPGPLALSLYGTFGRDVIALRHKPTTPPALTAVLRAIDAAKRPVVFAIAPQAVDGSLDRRDFTEFDVTPMGTESIHWMRIAPARAAIPSGTQAMDVTIDLYRVAPRDAHPLPLTIDIGPRDFGARLSGFYDVEGAGGAGARWTGETAEIDLPRVAAAGRTRLILRIAAPRPKAEPPAATTVSIDGRVIGLAANLSPDFHDVALALDPAVVRQLEAGPTTLTLRTPPFVSKDAAGADSRRLGIMVDWVRLEAR